jgi:peptidyl-dipeptidase A
MLVRRYQGIRLPAGERAGAPDWAAKIHLAVSPAYYHNYLLGEMFASQLWDYLGNASQPGREGAARVVFDRTSGDYLRREIFARGARLPWNELIRAATGEPLNPAHFVAHIRHTG